MILIPFKKVDRIGSIIYANRLLSLLPALLSMKPISFQSSPKTPDGPGASKSPCGQPDMDPEIWSRLPKEVLEHILSFLPLKTLMNLRSTCKNFKSLIYSPAVVARHSSSSCFSSFLLLSHPQCHGHFPLYDPIVGTWRDLAPSLSISVPCATPSTLLSSSHGLFCFSIPNFSSFLVCNFLARSSRIIEFPSYPFGFELLTLVSTSFGYKIFMLCSRSSCNRAFVYDSRARSWQNFDGFDPILSHNYYQGGVYFKGSLYFTTPEPFSIVCIDLENGVWERLETNLPSDLTFVRLVSDEEEKLYLVGGTGRNGISSSMNIWELDNERNWIGMEGLPEMMCRKFMSVSYHNYEHVYCFWHQKTVCVCCYNWPEILYYKVSRRTWHWLPKCPSLPEKWSCGFRWFSFVPDLYALA